MGGETKRFFICFQLFSNFQRVVVVYLGLH